ncbi:hypothetical protein QAD02_002702 [Eretmocerus hayati]|uniref:Uncharacterized protein n=1 Tax=Eretmocerus hayati TaxID=131215 RepID=A0ACC2NKL6_9HYME|nr:hypothetical protein QAD02_002702 [Eretmocerus hayati]
MMNEGYVGASSENLPRVDLEMLIEYISTSDLFQGCELRNLFPEFYSRSIDNNSHLLQFHSKNTVQNLSWHHQAISYSGNRNCPASFLEFCKETLAPEHCDYIPMITAQQSSFMSRFELRYGRITASIIYEEAVCKTTDSSLVGKILSMNNYDNPAMDRGRWQESQVRSGVQRILIRDWNEGKVKTSELILRRNSPALSVSPDGSTETAVVEIKCPSDEQTIASYHDGEGMKNEYKAQIQLQMIFSERRVGNFCIAATDFETSEKVTIYQLDYDQTFVIAVIRRAIASLSENIFPYLMRE